MFKIIATNEKEGISWQVHLFSGAVNITSGLITWLGFKRSLWAGVENFALNTIVAESQIWTQPTQTMKDYQSYYRKYKSGINPLAYKSKPTYYVCFYPGGIIINILF